jgi:hypothetical protein
MPIGSFVSLVIMLAWPLELKDVDRPFHRYTWRAFTSIDFIGGGSLFTSCCLLVYGIQEAGSRTAELGMSAWGGWEIVLALAVAGISAVVFVAWQAILGRDYFSHIRPVFPYRLFSRRVFMATLAYVRPRTSYPLRGH